jgi:hypothetical protein
VLKGQVSSRRNKNPAVELLMERSNSKIKEVDFMDTNEMAKHKIEQVKHILQQMIEGRKNVINGCAELSALSLAGFDFIYNDFDEYYSLLQQYPLPEEYQQWEKSALEKKLKELDELKHKIITLSMELLEEIK